MCAKIDKEKLEKLKSLDWKSELVLRPYPPACSIDDFRFLAETEKGRFTLSRGVSCYFLDYEPKDQHDSEYNVSVQLTNAAGEELWQYCHRCKVTRTVLTI